MNNSQLEDHEMAGSATEEFALTVLGSGGPILNTPRASSGFIVQIDGEARLLLDAGGGTSARVGELGIDLSTLTAACFSHLHIDHTSSFPALLKTALLEGLEELDVYGPTGNEPMPGTAEWLDKQFSPEEGTYRYLYEFAENIADSSLELTSHEVDSTIGEDNTAMTIMENDLTVEAIPVTHGPAPTLAYRISHNGQSITIATDLDSTSGNLPRLATDTDVLVHGASISPDVPDDEPVADLHSYPAQVAANAHEAKANTLVLVHLMPPSESNIENVIETVHEGYDGTVVVAEDRMRVHGDGTIE